MLLTRMDRLSETETQVLQNFCILALAGGGKLDISNYAKGRSRVWLFGEPDLRRNVVAVSPGYNANRKVVEYFRQLQQQIAPQSHFCLVAKGLISPHRDHRYSLGSTWSITTKPAIFEIWPRQTELAQCKRGTGELYELAAGEVTSFWSKCPHAVWWMAQQRISVTFWEARKEWVELQQLQ